MSTKEILDLLSRHRDELRRRGVRRLGLFGSAARGEAGEASDLDFLVDLEPRSFDAYMDLKFLLEALFHRPVDLVLADRLKARLRDAILAEVRYAPGL
jgi:uncharacterized protein